MWMTTRQSPYEHIVWGCVRYEMSHGGSIRLRHSLGRWVEFAWQRGLHGADSWAVIVRQCPANYLWLRLGLLSCPHCIICPSLQSTPTHLGCVKLLGECFHLHLPIMMPTRTRVISHHEWVSTRVSDGEYLFYSVRTNECFHPTITNE